MHRLLLDDAHHTFPKGFSGQILSVCVCVCVQWRCTAVVQGSATAPSAGVVRRRVTCVSGAIASVVSETSARPSLHTAQIHTSRR